MYLFVMVVGMAIMAVEMSASRILAPYFGASIFVWGNVIGVVMIALAFGYYFGGKLADRRPEPKILSYLVVAAGGLISIIPLLSKPVAQFLIPDSFSSYHLFLILGSMFFMLLLFAFPLFVLGMATPFVIRLLSQKVSASGQVAGTVYAFSTFGSILGTWLSAFIIIPLLGSRETILISAFLLIGLGVIYQSKKVWLWLFILLPIFVFWLSSGRQLSTKTGLVYEKESAYQLVQVVKEGSQYQLKHDQGFGMQSLYDSEQVFVDAYYDYYALLPGLVGLEDQQVLMIGAGGGTIPNIYLKALGDYYNFSIDSVEIDQEVVKAAELYLDYPSDQINTVFMDGRNFLRMTEEEYDIMIIDAYANRIYIPFYLTTQEFWQEAQTKLKRNGVLAINVNAVSVDTKIIQSISQTIKSVFNYTYLSPVVYSNNWL
ncbi:fused MFS/spermidine synthase, partial [Patescibacteria group bacterium]|nr:fused MFS/spermidine synthase [Patescibacteria group bacterium]